MRARRFRRRLRAALVSFVCALFLLVLLIVGNIYTERWEQAIRVNRGERSVTAAAPKGEGSGAQPVLFVPEFEDPEMLREASDALCRSVAEEGIVLLRNEGKVLPLRPGSKISVFGNPQVTAGAKEPDSMKDVLGQAGFHVNEALCDFYARGGGSSLTGKLQESLSEYGDAAIVVISRFPAGSAGESWLFGGSGRAASTDLTNEDLQLTAEEREMLLMAKGASETLIVVLNTSNPMEMGFLEEFGVDGCLWTGDLGRTGLYGLASVLNGTVNPSGRLTDTYVFDVRSAPSMANASAGIITNSTLDGGGRFQVLSEGIYVGYRYYETRYEDVVLGREAESFYNYAKTVAYPFGYGLSYTEFAWSGMRLRETADGWEVSLHVTNIGDQPGREVAEIYLQRPYTEYDRTNGIEKPAAELAGFAKTRLLGAGESETVTVTIPQEALDTFDPSAGAYIREKGTYYLTAARNAHQAVNNILEAKGGGDQAKMRGPGMSVPASEEESDAEMAVTITVAADFVSRNTEVRFTDADIRQYDDSFRYLSRSNWLGTWPVLYGSGEFTAPSRLLEDMRISTGRTDSRTAPVYNTLHGENALQLAELIDIPYGDYRWSWLLDQLSWKETYSFVRKAGGLTNAMASSGVPETFARDGGGELFSEEVIAASFNEDLALRAGQLIGENGLEDGYTFWYLPAFSVHRVMTGGCNAAEFSEDPLLAGRIGAALCRGAQDRGMVVVAGKLALSAQDQSGHGTAVFASEQAIRELYFSGMEYCVREGKPAGVTAGTGRIGPRWCGGHEGLLGGLLRGEWGFEGIVTTDLLSGEDEVCCDLLEGLSAGTDLWRNTDNKAYTLRGAQLTYGVRGLFRTAVQRAVFVISRSNAMNGLSGDTRLVYKRPGWRYIKMAVDLAVPVLIALLLFISFYLLFMRRRRRAVRPDEERRRR